MGLISFLVGAAGAAWTMLQGPDPADATDPTMASLAALDRAVRMANGEAVAVSLAGGGAWGLGHIGLLEHLDDKGLPCDFVAGVSSGSIVAAFHVWRTTAAAGLDELRKRNNQALPVAMTCVLSMRPLRRWVTSVTGGTLDTESEAGFLAFHTKVLDGEAARTTGHPLGEGVVASSSMPPLFAPWNYQNQPVIDGVFSHNLPPEEEIWAAGAGFFVTSNVIPQGPSGGSLTSFVFPPNLPPWGIRRRIRDVMYGAFHLLRNTSDFATMGTDLKFDADLHCWSPFDFDALVAIADRGKAQATSELSGAADPAWAYHAWMNANGTPTGVLLGPPGPPPPTIPSPSTPCP